IPGLERQTVGSAPKHAEDGAERSPHVWEGPAHFTSAFISAGRGGPSRPRERGWNADPSNGSAFQGAGLTAAPSLDAIRDEGRLPPTRCSQRKIRGACRLEEGAPYRWNVDGGRRWPGRIPRGNTTRSMRRLVAVALGLGLELGTGVARATSPGLSVETGSPDALCPDLNRTREAVGRRLGALEVPSGRGWRARYTIGHAPEGSPRDFVRLELFAPDGRVRLTRNLPLGSDSCSAMADVIALVLDRYFRSLADHAAPARTRAERTTDPSVTLARPSSSSSSAPPADSGSDSNAANDGPAES